MKVFLGVLLLVTTAVNSRELVAEETTAYGYLTKYGVPEAERIRKAEEAYHNDPSRIVGGNPAALGQYPWQVIIFCDLIMKF